tara:strand:+ start:44 stop:271 length:228 start_codon:yes stop_codon:yes gene_type:complete
MYGTLCYNVPYNRKDNMINKIQEAVVKSMDMHKTGAESMMKLGKVVEVNTNHLNMVATRLLQLEKRIARLESEKK